MHINTFNFAKMASGDQEVDPLDEVVCVSLRKVSGQFLMGGFRKDLLKCEQSNLEAHLVICPECQGILRDAMVLNGKTTCRDCCEDTDRAVPSEVMRESVRKMAGKCPYNESGCEWTGELGEVKQHISACKFFLRKCPYAKYGCPFQTKDRNEMAAHTTEFSPQHCEMRLIALENENTALRETHTSLKKKLTSLLDRSRISKFVENRKKCLEGVEWRIREGDIVGRQGELDGPTFYIKGYHLQLVGKVGSNVMFHIRRIAGEFDEGLSPAKLTYSSVEQVGREKTSNNTHNHALEVNAMSEDIDHGRCAASLMRFYFDIEEY